MDGKPPEQPRQERRRSFAARLVAGGFGVVALSMVVGVLAGNSHAALQWVGPSAIGLAAAALVVLTGRLFVPAAVLALLFVAMYALVGTMELSHPESFADFVPALWRVVGALIALCGAMVGIAQRRRGTLGRPSARQRTAALLVAALLVGGGVASFALDARSSATVRNPAGAIEVVTEGDEFEPDTFELERGERVTFLVRNTDSYAHTFTVDDLAVDVYVGPRTERLVTFDVDIPPGTGTRRIVLSCAVTGHEDMLGTIRVT